MTHLKLRISRDLTFALLISLGVHVFGMSAVAIVIPEPVERTRLYTRVDFLGPILRKTAFDIMLENATPVVRTTYKYAESSPWNKNLEVKFTRKKIDVQEFPKNIEDNMDISVRTSLTDAKIAPDFIFDSFGPDLVSEIWPDKSNPENKRRVVYKPMPPFIIKGLYGDKGIFRVRVRALIDANGNVKKTELVTTTGFPRLDITIAEFVKSWVFEPSGLFAGADEWHEVEAVLGQESNK